MNPFSHIPGWRRIILQNPFFSYPRLEAHYTTNPFFSYPRLEAHYTTKPRGRTAHLNKRPVERSSQVPRRGRPPANDRNERFQVFLVKKHGEKCSLDPNLSFTKKWNNTPPPRKKKNRERIFELSLCDYGNISKYKKKLEVGIYTK